MPDTRGRRFTDRIVPVGDQHATGETDAETAAEGCTAVEERGVASGGRAPGPVRDLAEPRAERRGAEGAVPRRGLAAGAAGEADREGAGGGGGGGARGRQQGAAG